MRVIVAVVLSMMACITASVPVTVFKEVTVDTFGGRHPGILIGEDKLPFMIFLSDSRGSVGVAHCEDVLCANSTIWYLDTEMPGAGNQNALRAYKRTGHPQFIYSLNATDEYRIILVTCYDTTCSNHDKTTVKSLSNVNKDNMYLDLEYDPYTGLPVISYNNDPDGLFFIQCYNSLCNSSAEHRIDARFPYTGWYANMEILPTDNEAYILTFVYYCNTTFEVLHTTVAYNDFSKVVSQGVLETGVHGGWLSTIITQTGIGFTFVDLSSENGSYSYCNCKREASNFTGCACSPIDNGLGQGYDLWVYPDLTVLPEFSPYPVTSYFHSTSLRFARCDSWDCSGVEMQQLSQGGFGYGRDSKLLWDNQLQLMYLPFLDYNGNGIDKKCKLLILKKEQ
eukprot:TRINITY_DN5694_c0_g2_i1.p1 TRINITY_DN5694_c0_g2~~TRINITY_DN5694_c0_g2_i1.p1  ORF type:complete len:401 (+),score=66.45 TRINITY_DN5694_c0_g2_i1:23-1204(+)